MEVYLDRKDPVRKAKRILNKQTSPCANRVGVANKVAEAIRSNEVAGRKPLSAFEKHQVFARDEGRCTFHDAHGNRCNNQKWIDLHHIRPVSESGGNEKSNITTLCSSHHDFVHQHSLPIDGQINWLRSPNTPYIRTVKTAMEEKFLR